MKIISHRGVLEGPNPLIENHPSQIDYAISCKFEVEVDLWKISEKFYLGHDEPNLITSYEWLEFRFDKLWIHCKNIEALDFFVKNNLNCNYFFHQNDHVVLTSKNYLWVFPNKEYTENSIVVAITKNSILDVARSKIIPFGVCTDYPLYFQNKLESS